MGTSSSYPGLPGGTPLLPPWADPIPDDSGDGDDGRDDGDGGNGEDSPSDDTNDSNDGNGNNDDVNRDGSNGNIPNQPPSPGPTSPASPQKPIKPYSWAATKGGTTRWVNGKSGSAGRVASNYVRSKGGAARATTSASAGRSATARLGGFLSDVARLGLREAARRAGLGDIVGRDVNSAVAAIIDRLAPDGALREESAARKAIIETLNEVCDRFNLTQNGLAALEVLDATAAREIVLLSVANFVNEQFQQELMVCFERGDVSEARANHLSGQMREYILSSTRSDYSGLDVLNLDWNAEGQTIAARIYRDAYGFLERNADDEQGRQRRNNDN